MAGRQVRREAHGIPTRPMNAEIYSEAIKRNTLRAPVTLLKGHGVSPDASLVNRVGEIKVFGVFGGDERDVDHDVLRHELDCIGFASF